MYAGAFICGRKGGIGRGVSEEGEGGGGFQINHLIARVIEMNRCSEQNRKFANADVSSAEPFCRLTLQK